MFEYTSESDDTIGRALNFYFSFHSTMSAIELKFPVGDTYKFSLQLYSSHGGDPVLSITVRNYVGW